MEERTDETGQIEQIVSEFEERLNEVGAVGIIAIYKGDSRLGDNAYIFDNVMGIAGHDNAPVAQILHERITESIQSELGM